MRSFGEKAGIAFQIKDDLFDYASENVGKPTGNDIKEKKLTLPLIYTLNNIDKSKKRELIYIIKNENRDAKKIKEVSEEMIVWKTEGTKLYQQLPFEMKRTDDQIAEALLDRLAWDVSVPKDRVKVKVEKGWITLTGDVDWHFQSEAAEDACRRMHGVLSVLNRITIKPPVRPSEIQEKIKAALHRSWYEPLNITVHADGGKVRLNGSVRSWNERRQAENVAWNAPGVTMVDDSITID